jgi:chorismate mutase/prephenate dehydratase
MKKPDLSRLRAEIDAIDDEIVRALDRRAKAVHEVGEQKRSAGAGFYVPERERAVLDRVAGVSDGSFPEESLRTVFREIISASLALEQPLTVSFLGPEGTFSHQAAKAHFGLGARLMPARTIHDVFDEVERGRAAYGIVPIENTTEGVVGETLDRFLSTTLAIVAERVEEVSLSLLSRTGHIEDVQTVFTHPQPAAQCRGWIRDHLRDVKLVEVGSTAMAARLASEDPASAAIAGEAAARLYDLRVVRARIEDHAWNFTRFLVLGPQPVGPTGADKTSLIVAAEHRPGGLFDVLAPLAEGGINLSKIESRPRREHPFEYLFFVDLEGHQSDAPVAAALAEVRARASYLKVLGSYPRAERRLAPQGSAP